MEFSKQVSTRQSILTSKRGAIFDRNNLVLAEDIPSYEVGLSLKDFSFDPHHIDLLSSNLEINFERLKKRLANKKAKYLVLKHKVTKQKKNIYRH